MHTNEQEFGLQFTVDDLSAKMGRFMSHPDVQIVWFKRDLRVNDHAALTAAVQSGAPVLPLYIFEPSLITHPHTSPRHIELVLDGLNDLRQSLLALGAPLVVRVGEVVQILEELSNQVGIESIHSHEEFGVELTWKRDRAVAAWARARGVKYREHRQTGAMRGLASRDQWSRQRTALFNKPLLRVPVAIRSTSATPGPMPTLRELGLTTENMVYRQRGGERAARDVLRTWIDQRIAGYERHLSSPVTGESGCSRLSVHLALGTISAREVHAEVQLRKSETSAPKFSLKAFEGRVAWRDHFAQKLEDAPHIEYRALHPAFDKLRPTDANTELLEAFTQGKTGYPMVDAVVRSLAATGWTTFRMRSMITSFASYDLWLPWQETGRVLARWFTDYDPGIHWPQIQMQSGVTGMNTLRIYDPIKQQSDHDPTGEFVRKWVPELRDVPLSVLSIPWFVPSELRQNYPEPIVDHAAAVAQAKRKISAVREQIKGDGSTRALLERHGSRRRSPSSHRR